MRFLFVGDLDLLAGLAGACEEAGHDVALATALSSCAAVEVRGFESFAVGLDVAADAEHTVAALAGDVAPLALQWGADLLVHDAHELGAVIAAEQSRLPRVEVGSGPVWPRPLVAARSATVLDAVRVDFGLHPDPGFEQAWNAPHLSAWPPSLQATFDPRRWRPAMTYLRPSVAAPAVGDVASGAGDWLSTVAALTAGAPLLLSPTTDEERDRAFRVAACGAGIVGGTTQDLLDEPLYYANARRLRREIESMPDAAASVTVLVDAARSDPAAGSSR